jgi:formylglycine-generating enzyme required for sulfatase activity/DNA-directed RNA polymerase subunit M/transcription elongation factor TFIIS
MHCDRCNIDFPEGLHYCKWCGGALIDHPRITSELHTCPSCGVAIQPAWTFCKACGERLHRAVSEPAGKVCPECGAGVEPGVRNCPRCNKELAGEAANQIVQDSSDTMVIVTCPSCGDYVEAGTLYCKACGSAVYTQQTPFGASALLCGACNSYSPFGSRACRVCGAALVHQAPQTVVDRPAFVPQQSGTSGEGAPQKEGAESQEAPEHTSGANTIVFGGSEREKQPVNARPKPSVQTSVLPGTAGSRSEQPTKTSVVQMGRITSPVEESQTRDEDALSSGELEQTAPSDDDRAAVIELRKEVPAKQADLPESTTFGFASEPVTPHVFSQGLTGDFFPPVVKSPSTPAEQAAQDDIHTREFAIPQPHDKETPTRVQQAWPGPVPNEGANTRASAQSGDAGITREIASAGVTTLPVEEASSQPLAKKRTGVVIASVTVAVIVIVAAVVLGYWLLFARGRVARQPAPSVISETHRVAPEPPATPPKPTAPVVPEGMLAVAAGSYTIGRNGADPLEQPQHKMDLSAFFIDRTEVTNAAYKKFVDATGHKPPTNWIGASFPDHHDNFPVTGVTWQDAADYAAWAGKRLPSEAEWEAAARGADGRIYPWGNEWRAGLANIGLKPDDIRAEQYPSGMKEVGQYPQGASPAGAVDMIGNAWEWVADEITIYPGNTETKLPLKPGVNYRVIRGGAYDGNKTHDATYRGFLDASQPYPKVGFRCVKDAK